MNIRDLYLAGLVGPTEYDEAWRLGFRGHRPDAFYTDVVGMHPDWIPGLAGGLGRLAKRNPAFWHGYHVYDSGLILGGGGRKINGMVDEFRLIQAISEFGEVGVLGSPALWGAVLPNAVASGGVRCYTKIRQLTKTYSGRCFTMSRVTLQRLRNHSSDAVKKAAAAMLRSGNYANILPAVVFDADGGRTTGPGLTALIHEYRDRHTERIAAYHKKMERAHASDEGALLACLTDAGHRMAVLQDIEKVLDPTNGMARDAILERLYPFTDVGMRRRMRVDGRECLRMVDYLCLKYGATFTRQLLHDSGGMGLQGLAGLLLSCVSGGHQLFAVCYMLSRGHGTHGISHWIKCCKDVHDAVRRAGILPTYVSIDNVHVSYRTAVDTTQKPDYYNFLYLHLLAGRFFNLLLAADGYVEKRSHNTRPHPLYVDGDSTADAVKKWDDYTASYLNRVTEALSKAIGARDISPTDWLAQFVSQAPPGAVTADTEGRLDWLAGEHSRLGNKRVWLASLSVDDILHAHERLADGIATTAIIKVEPAKLRQLIPGPVWHWLCETICVGLVSEAMYKSTGDFNLGMDQRKQMWYLLDRRLRSLGIGGWNVASDYADFNFLHTIPDMQRFWLMYRIAALQHAGPGDWNGINYAGFIALVSQALSRALERMYVREATGDGLFHYVYRGLWSGWRTTSDINNCMNAMYGGALEKAVDDILGGKSFMFKSVNGDDGDAEMVSMLAALTYLYLLDAADLDVAPGKQMLAKYRNEFLRTTCENGVVRMSLSRAIASFIGSDMQAPEVAFGRDYAKGTCEAIHMMVRRGASPEYWFGTSGNKTAPGVEMLRRLATPSYMIDGIRHKAAEPNVHALFLSDKQGGVGCTRYGDVTQYAANLSKWPVVQISALHKGAYPGEAVAAVRAVVSEKLIKHGLAVESVELVTAAAEDITYAGMGDDAETVRRDNAVLILEKYEELSRCRELKHVEVQIPDEVSIAIDRYWSDLFTEDRTLLRLRGIPDDIEAKILAATGKALGVMNLSPRILTNLRDERTGEKLKTRQALDRLGVLPDLAYFYSRMPAQHVDYLVELGSNLPKQTYGLLPVQLVPAIPGLWYVCLEVYLSNKTAYAQDPSEFWTVLLPSWVAHAATVFNRRYSTMFKC